MPMRKILVVVLVTVAATAVPQPASAWGYDVHKFIMQRAIPLLPAEIRPFFNKFQTTIVEHAIDPDTWRTVGWEAETPRHFVDMDAYGAYPFKELPHGYEQAVQKYGREFVERNGTLPWRTEEIYKKLVEAFTQKAPYARENIKLFSSVIAHYTADAHVPFHAALNYDGQLTGQWGIHSRFESELFGRFKSTLQLRPGPSSRSPARGSSCSTRSWRVSRSCSRCSTPTRPRSRGASSTTTRTSRRFSGRSSRSSRSGSRIRSRTSRR